MGSRVGAAELGIGSPKQKSNREGLDLDQESLDAFESSEQKSESLGTFLSGRLAGTDVEPVEEVRQLRRRERE